MVYVQHYVFYFLFSFQTLAIPLLPSLLFLMLGVLNLVLKKLPARVSVAAGVSRTAGTDPADDSAEVGMSKESSPSNLELNAWWIPVLALPIITPLVLMCVHYSAEAGSLKIKFLH